MIRRILLASVVFGGLASGLALTPSTASANEPADFHHHHRFEVVYLHCNHWHVHGVYRDFCDAERAAHHLRHHGRVVEIRRI